MSNRQTGYILPVEKDGKHGWKSGTKAILRHHTSAYAVQANRETNLGQLVPIVARN